MLFFLLQLEWLFERMDVSEHIDHYLERIKVLDPSFDLSPDIEKVMRDQITVQIRTAVLHKTVEELNQIEEGYKATVLELSYVAPFMAFQLEGRTTILSRLEDAKRSLDQMLDPLNGILPGMLGQLKMDDSLKAEILQDQGQAFNEQIRTIKEVYVGMQPDVIEDDLEHMRKIMHSLAIRIGLLTWLRIKRGYGDRGKLPVEDAEAIDVYVEQLLKAFPAPQTTQRNHG